MHVVVFTIGHGARPAEELVASLREAVRAGKLYLSGSLVA
jgi:hypothetical protein